MDVLKRGLDFGYYAFKNMSLVPATTEEVELKQYTTTIIEGVDTAYVMNITGSDMTYLDMNMYSDVSGNFVDKNNGMHSRGTGNSEYNLYYALNDTCIARYNGELEEYSDGSVGVPDYTKEEELSYVADLLLDELALEFCFEGQRFGDLIRFAKAAERAGDPNWKDILVKRVAGRNVENTVSYRSNEYVIGETYGLNDEKNWYLPFPNDELLDSEDTYEPNEQPEDETPEDAPEEGDDVVDEIPEENTPEDGGETNE